MSAPREILARIGVIAGMALCVAGLANLFQQDDPNAAPHAQDTPSETFAVKAMAESWNGEIDFAPAYAALNPYADLSQTTPASAFDPGDDYWGLPRTQGYDTVAAYCSACHTLQIVMAQRQPREGWDYLLHWMVEKQGMAEPPPETRAEILNYLALNFGE